MRARNSNISISPYGGVLPILKNLKESGIPQLIRSELGKRKEQATYGYDDILIAWTITALCGGKRLEHISRYRKPLEVIRGLKLPSHDTLGRVMKKLATETITKEVISPCRGKYKINNNYVNDNLKMNRMLIKATKRLGALKEGITYTLHIDATFVKTLCVGSNLSPEKITHGFNPMVCSIGDLIVFVSMRNGDSNSKFQIKECLEQCLEILEENNIKIGKVISDGAGYDKAVIDMLDKRGVKFTIHAPTNQNYKKMRKQLDENTNWKQTVIETAWEFKYCEIGEIEYKMVGGVKPYRLIAARMPKDGTGIKKNKSVEKIMTELEKKKKLKSYNDKYPLGKWKILGKHKVKLIITNDYFKSPEEIVKEYNKRGAAEKEFDYMKNDFGWKLPPFQKMNENAVFFIASALANNVMRAMVMKFKKVIPELRLEARLYDFVFSFVIVCVSYINKQYVFYDAQFDYVKLLV